MGRIKDLIISMTDSEQYVPSRKSLKISVMLLVISILVFFIGYYVFDNGTFLGPNLSLIVLIWNLNLFFY